MAVFAPMPSGRIRTTTAVKPDSCAFVASRRQGPASSSPAQDVRGDHDRPLWLAPARRISAAPRGGPVPESSRRGRCPRSASGGGSRIPLPVHAPRGPWQRSQTAGRRRHEWLSWRLLRWRKESGDDSSGPIPVPRLPFELSLPGTCQDIVLCPAIVVRDAPLCGNVSLLFEFQQSWIQGSVSHRKQISAGLLDAAGDAVSVQGPERFQSLQDHQGKRALPNIDFFSHAPPTVYQYEEYQILYWKTIGARKGSVPRLSIPHVP